MGSFGASAGAGGGGVRGAIRARGGRVRLALWALSGELGLGNRVRSGNTVGEEIKPFISFVNHPG